MHARRLGPAESTRECRGVSRSRHVDQHGPFRKPSAYNRVGVRRQTRKPACPLSLTQVRVHELDTWVSMGMGGGHGFESRESAGKGEVAGEFRRCPRNEEQGTVFVEASRECNSARVGVGRSWFFVEVVIRIPYKDHAEVCHGSKNSAARPDDEA